MTNEKNVIESKIIIALNVSSKASLALFSPAEINLRVSTMTQEHDWNSLLQLHAEARKEYDKLRILEKRFKIRGSPLLPAAVKQGLMNKSISLLGYEEWFDGRAENYAYPGEVSSMFSPAAYLSTLYRQARAVYNESSHWHIDRRRPDLKNLVLSQENMDTPISALSLSNEILFTRVREDMISPGGEVPSQDKVLEVFSSALIGSGMPYHHHYSRMFQVRLLQDPHFTHLQTAPHVTKHLNGPALTAMYYNISPALCRLLMDETNAGNAQTKFEEQFGSVSPEMMLKPTMLMHWYGLTAEEIRAFDIDGTLVAGDYSDNIMTTIINGHYYRVEITSSYNNFKVYPLSETTIRVEGDIRFSGAPGQVIVKQTGITRANKCWLNPKEYDCGSFYNETLDITQAQGQGDDTFKINGTESIELIHSVNGEETETIGIVEWKIIPLGNEYNYVLLLDKAIRLYQATGLHPRVLKDIVDSVNPVQITEATFNLLFHTLLSIERHSIPHEEGLLMARGTISLTSSPGNLSHWDRLFNNPPLTNESFVPSNNLSIIFRPEYADQHADIKATLKRALQTDDDGLFHLKMILNSVDITAVMTISQTLISRLYTLSLWSRQYGLHPSELRHLLIMLGLPSSLYLQNVGVWYGLLDKLHAVTNWLNARNWTVNDLVLMTRSVTGLPASTEISNFCRQLRDVVQGSNEPADVISEERLRVLSPLVTAVFSLNSETSGTALLRWADSASPQGQGIDGVWDMLAAQAPEPEPAILVNFAYTLAQMALIYHATGITPDAIALFVSKPDALLDKSPYIHSFLPRTLPVIMALADFSDWLRTLPDRASGNGRIISELARDGLTADLLAQSIGLDISLVTAAMTQARAYEDISDSAQLAGHESIQVVLQWIRLSSAFNVSPAGIGNMLALGQEYTLQPTTLSEPLDASSWAKWKSIADVFEAGLRPVQVEVLHKGLAAQLSSALSGYLTRQGGIAENREQLFNYLLADSLNGPQIVTTRLADALSALQAFIHLALNLNDDSLESTLLRREVFDRQFFRDWIQWNARYSTWAAGQKLMYYPENYIDPTVRLGQTKMMDEMLQVLGQVQINTDTVGDAFMGYLTGFEEVANLETVSGYHDSENPEEGKTWFVGRSQSSSSEYWWRSVDEGKRTPEGVLPANAWTGWEKITCAPSPFGDLIRPVVYRDRLYLGWVERNRHVIKRDDNGNEAVWENRWALKITWLRYDGSWNMPAVHEYSKEAGNLIEGLIKTPATELSLYLSAWTSRQTILGGVYIKGATSSSQFAGELSIYEDLSSSNTTTVTANWPALQQNLDILSENRVLQPFRETQILLENNLTTPSGLPTGFVRFDVSDVRASIVYLEKANDVTTYNLLLGCTETLEMIRPEFDNLSIRLIFQIFDEIRPETQALKVFGLTNDLGTIILRQESGSWWGYLASPSLGVFGLCWDRNFGDSYSEYSEIYTTSDQNIKVAKIKIHPTTMSFFNNNTLDKVMFTLDAGLPDFVYFSGDFLLPGGQTTSITPIRFSANLVIDRNNISYYIDNSSRVYTANRNLDLSRGPGSFTWSANNIFPVDGSRFTFPGNATEVIHTVVFRVNNMTRTWKLRVYKDDSTLKADIIGIIETNGEQAQFLQHAAYRTRLNTLFARQLTGKSVGGIDAILNYSSQDLPEPPLHLQSTEITFEPYNLATHGDGSFRLYYVGVKTHRDQYMALSGRLNMDGTPTKIILPLPSIKGKTGPENALLMIGVIYSHEEYLGSYRNMYGFVYQASTDSFIFDSSNDKIPGTSACRLLSSLPATMDFSGANALYFWELFYYTPMMVMQRFLQEEQYDLAEKWLKYVFSPSGYIVQGTQERRMWNVRPLNDDTSWNDEPMLSYDPDAVAQNDPMHYKLNAFMRQLDIVIGKGDAAYRKLERDTLAEAKIWYGRALTLLGQQPWIDAGRLWDNPTLGTAASESALIEHIDTLSLLAQRITLHSNTPFADLTDSTLFLPEMNEVMLGYWETLRLRLYNLRHNLTINGQPLNLPLFAPPGDPKALLAAAVASEGASDSLLPSLKAIPALRFTPLLESARSMASQLIEFGSSLQQILVDHDEAEMATMLIEQGDTLAKSSVSLQRQSLEELNAERKTLEAGLAAVKVRSAHYLSLYRENINHREALGMDLSTLAQVLRMTLTPLYTAGAVAAIAPNVFGLANGGMKYGGPIYAVANAMEQVSAGVEIASERIVKEEEFRRRREEWNIQHLSAEEEAVVYTRELEALTVRETSLNMQIIQMETQALQAQEQLVLFQNAFTGTAMYSWLRARLTTIFYQYYDLTASCCLMVQEALRWEKNDTSTYLRTGTWNGAWAGLMSGEGLMLSLAQMEMAWIKHQKRELEVTRTLSLAHFFSGRLGGASLSEAIIAIVKGQSGIGDSPNRIELVEGQMAVHFNLQDFALTQDYSRDRRCRIRSIAVTLPGLPDSYQSIRGLLRTNFSSVMLPVGCNESAISHAIRDNGLFEDSDNHPRWGGRWRPFEGLPADDASGMTLSFADAQGEQKTLLENLSDIILHIQFTVN